MAAQGWWIVQELEHACTSKQLLMSPRFEYCGSETIHCIEFVISSQPLLQEYSYDSHSSKYVS